jgi:hypothetical protein
MPDKEHVEELCWDVYKELRKILNHEPIQRKNYNKSMDSIV